MFCPRCGRRVSDTANFCGGCGLPKAEIEKTIRIKAEQMATPPVAPAPDVNIRPEIPPVNIADINNELSKLEKDLTGAAPVNDYTTDTAVNTNTDDSFSFTSSTEEAAGTNTAGGQSEYSYNAPKSPFAQQETGPSTPTQRVRRVLDDFDDFDDFDFDEEETNQNLSTVDYIWMMLISGLPVVGLIYLIWLGFIQTDNVNKKSFARATLIISLFALLMAVVFVMGIIMAQAY